LIFFSLTSWKLKTIWRNYTKYKIFEIKKNVFVLKGSSFVHVWIQWIKWKGFYIIKRKILRFFTNYKSKNNGKVINLEYGVLEPRNWHFWNFYLETNLVSKTVISNLISKGITFRLFSRYLLLQFMRFYKRPSRSLFSRYLYSRSNNSLKIKNRRNIRICENVKIRETKNKKFCKIT